MRMEGWANIAKQWHLIFFYNYCRNYPSNAIKGTLLFLLLFLSCSFGHKSNFFKYEANLISTKLNT